MPVDRTYQAADDGRGLSLNTAAAGSLILLFPLGSAGDVHPYVGIGRALRSRGHRVRLFANSYFESIARDAGIEFESTGTTDEYLEALNDPGLWDSKGSYRVLFGKLIDATELVYRRIEAHHQPGQTVLVAPSAAFGARIANEKLGVPLVSMNVELNIFRSVYEQPGRDVNERWKPLLRPFRRAIMEAADRLVFDPQLAPGVNGLRSSLGLSPVRFVMRKWLHSPDCVIGLFPEWFAPKLPDWPANLHLTGFPLFDGSETGSLSAELEEFLAAGEPPVVFTFGTAQRNASDLLETSVRVCQSLGRRGILLTQFADQAPLNLPATVQYIRYAPLSSLLPRSAAIVHHGGIGTTAQALRAGIPQLVCPMILDQFDNAVRLQRLGVGESIRSSRISADYVAERLQVLMASPAVASRCRNVAQRFGAGDPVSQTCNLIESVLPVPLTPQQGSLS